MQLTTLYSSKMPPKRSMNIALKLLCALSCVLSCAMLCVPYAYSQPATTIGVSVLPQKYFVERIAGDKARVLVMVGPGHNPVSYDPKPKQIMQLQQAKLYFLIGVPFEAKWIKSLTQTNSQLKLVSLPNGIKFRTMNGSVENLSAVKQDAHETDTHTHHSAMVDPHIWLNPRLVKEIALSMLSAIIDIDSENKDYYELNYQAFIDELDGLDQSIRQQLATVKSRSFMVFHPSWGYYADEYGLQQIPIELEGKQPRAKSLSQLIELARRNQIKVIFTQQQFSRRDAKTIADQIGAKIVTVDPLSENYIENLKQTTELFVEALS